MMTLAEASHGPSWVLYLITVMFLAADVLFISGHGAWLIAGYNTASKSEKAKYDEKKLCRSFGIALLPIPIVLLAACLFEQVLPASFAYIMCTVIVLDVIALLIVGNVTGRKNKP
ncbi:MAG TPA: DUF3784 domain-containing protein [Lachnospiraceae bacterium]|nr:DUF3784 domain-containing protein [Lachnospiraceae bacterium]